MNIQVALSPLEAHLGAHGMAHFTARLTPCRGEFVVSLLANSNGLVSG